MFHSFECVCVVWMFYPPPHPHNLHRHQRLFILFLSFVHQWNWYVDKFQVIQIKVWNWFGWGGVVWCFTPPPPPPCPWFSKTSRVVHTFLVLRPLLRLISEQLSCRGLNDFFKAWNRFQTRRTCCDYAQLTIILQYGVINPPPHPHHCLGLHLPKTQPKFWYLVTLTWFL